MICTKEQLIEDCLEDFIITDFCKCGGRTTTTHVGKNVWEMGIPRHILLEGMKISMGIHSEFFTKFLCRNRFSIQLIFFYNFWKMNKI